MPVALRGEGIYLVDDHERFFLDASGGAAVSSLGHSHPKVIKAIQQQVETMAYAHTAFFTNDPMESLAEALVSVAPGDLNRAFFVSGGSEAVEAGIKLARQYFIEIGAPERRHIIGRRQSYHGNTLGALMVGENTPRKRPFTPLLQASHPIGPCYPYRYQGDNESPEEYGLRSANELEERILELGPETVMGFIAEPVVGATAGALTPAPGYFRRIREICDHYNILLILDEVMCGMGRTGTLFAHEQEGIDADLVCIAKGLGAGYQPIGALLASEQIYQAVIDGSGSLWNGHTYLGHATACAAGLAVMGVITEENLLERIRTRGQQLRSGLERALGDHPNVGEIRGRGLFVGIELVADRFTKEPFEPELKIHSKINLAALDRQLICYPSGGTVDGNRGDHILLAPPFIVTEAEIDEIIFRLSQAIKDILPESL
jgi:hypothetical protein|tara:strand:- start:2216 stop:3511 length:1296 start_codon:yes stop_codon:yes gene_type:complete